MIIRAYRDGDASALADIFYDSVRQAARRDYSEEQVAAWAPVKPDPARFVARAADGRLTLVAADEDDVPVAYGDLELNGHIDHLYCRPDKVGSGIASRLYDEIERRARAMGISRLFVEASEAARRLFLRKGFAVTARRDFDRNGIALHNYAMEKTLA